MLNHQKKSSTLVLLIVLLLVLSTLQAIAGEDKGTEISILQVEKAYHLIQENYVNPDSVSKKKLIMGAIEGMLEELPDSHNELYTKESYQEFYKKVVRSSYVGVGVVLGDTGKHISVMETFPYNSASQKGVKPGDKILEIDGKSTAEMTYRDAREDLRGKQGEEVKLKIEHPNEKKRRNYFEEDPGSNTRCGARIIAGRKNWPD